MRRYLHNSPEAAARIVALVVVADGHFCGAESETLKQLGAEQELGLDPQFLPHIVHTLCEELMVDGQATGSQWNKVNDPTLEALMAEISDPVLRRKVLRLCLAAARADGHVADSEAVVVEAARRHWQLVDGEEPTAKRSARWQEK